MSELPVAGMKVEFARQIRSDAAGAPKLRVIVFRLPWFSRRAETAYIRRERPERRGSGSWCKPREMRSGSTGKWQRRR